MWRTLNLNARKQIQMGRILHRTSYTNFSNIFVLAPMYCRNNLLNAQHTYYYGGKTRQNLAGMWLKGQIQIPNPKVQGWCMMHNANHTVDHGGRRQPILELIIIYMIIFFPSTLRHGKFTHKNSHYIRPCYRLTAFFTRAGSPSPSPSALAAGWCVPITIMNNEHQRFAVGYWWWRY